MQTEFFQRYLQDFICMTMNVTSQEDLQVHVLFVCFFLIPKALLPWGTSWWCSVTITHSICLSSFFVVPWVVVSVSCGCNSMPWMQWYLFHGFMLPIISSRTDCRTYPEWCALSPKWSSTSQRIIILDLGTKWWAFRNYFHFFDTTSFPPFPPYHIQWSYLPFLLGTRCVCCFCMCGVPGTKKPWHRCSKTSLAWTGQKTPGPHWVNLLRGQCETLWREEQGARL